MQTGHHYPASQVLLWTRRDILQHLVIATVITVAYAVLGWRWLAIPWLPVALIGTAVAFLTGFKNNASYDRLWEARRIWGAIVNASRTWGVMARDYVTDRAAPPGTTAAEVATEHRVLLHRHFAWLTALRFGLREPRAWEGVHRPENAEFRARWFRVAEQPQDLGAALLPYLEPAEHDAVMAKANKAARRSWRSSRHISNGCSGAA
jgi:ion channel-forming bestrophin family protein